MVVTHLVRKRRGLVAGNAGYHQLARPLLGGTAKFSELNSLGADSDNSEDENVLPPEVHQHFHRGATQQTNSFVTGPTEPA